MKIGKGLLGISITALLLGSLASGAASAAGLTMARVQNNTPPALAHARVVRHHNPSAVLDIRVALPLRNADQLAQLLHDLHDRSSPNYGHYLTPQQFKTQFGPTDDQVASMVGFLEGKGLKVTEISKSNTRIHATGKTSVLERAFGVTINDYSAGGKSFYSANGNPLLPAGAMAVLGLDDAVTLRPHMMASTTRSRPAGVFGGPSGFMPLQIAHAYDWPDITDTANGAGVTIGIATAYSFRTQDLKTFWATAGLPSHTVTVVAVDSKPTKVLNGETTLDIERSSSMAPGAAIKVYECVNPAFVCFDDEFQEIAGDNLVQVVSTSWGSPESNNSFSSIGAEHESFTTMVAEGMTIMAAAGDNGAADGAAGPDNADFPSSDPLVIAAGGTSLTLDAGNNITAESAWGGAGGADSAIFAEPSYQGGAIAGFTHNKSCPSNLTLAPGATTDFPTTSADLCAAKLAPSRQSSDIALDADPSTGYALYYDGRWVVFGGTSFVAPELAGFFANLVQQHGGSIGNGNDFIYCAGTGGNVATDFHDITDGSNGPNGVFDAGTGWDHPTGFGTPDASNLITDILANCPF